MSKLILMAALTWFLFACSNSDKPLGAIVSVDESYEGMLVLEASGKTILLGVNGVNVPSRETPEMAVRLDYSFSMGIHEVTCGEFAALMGSHEACENSEYPVTGVTYFDAVLFANAKSKSEGKDTVYTYSKVSYEGSGRCVNLEGLVFHPEVDGFRLPTEAEWVLAASIGWNPANGWNSTNSGHHLHKVCSAQDVGEETAESIDKYTVFCDMAGNAMEWVNDWQGQFRDTTVTNYVGAPDGGAREERVVKGGSFRNDPSTMKLYSRGDVYTVTSSTMAEYVGFRIAYGSIPNAVWMSSNGAASGSRFVTLATSAQVKSMTGSFHTKLAFRNDLTGNLAFIDYASGLPSVVEVADTMEVYHPEISPDGNRVAFCTKLEGVSGKSALYVRNLKADGSGLVKLDVESAAIPRWRITETGDTAIVYVTDAGNNKDMASFKSASTWQVTFENGKFGTPTKLCDGAFHGGISSDNQLAVTGARLLRARVGNSDTLWYNGEQACNVSLSRDSSNRTVFLDFGGATGRSFVGNDYGVHEALLVVDSTGNLVRAVPAPTGYSFDHTEWLVGDMSPVSGYQGEGGLVVATLANANGVHGKIVLVDIADSSITDLVEGDELWHPSFWTMDVSKRIDAGSVNVDSAGVYFGDGGGQAAIILRYKLDLLWNYKDEAKVVILGSSRSMNGLNPLEMDENLFTINLSNVPNSMFVSDYLLQNYVIPHVKNIKYLVLSLDIDMWWKKENNNDDNFFYSEYRQYPGYVYDENHSFWKDGVPKDLPYLTSVSPGMDYYYYNFIPTRGVNANNMECGGWATATVDRDSNWVKDDGMLFENNLQRLERMVETAANRNIVVVGIIFPMSPGYASTGSFGRYGIRRSEAPGLIKKIKAISDRFPNFILMDENKMGAHDYDDAMAENNDHLCLVGASQMTSRLNELLKKLD